MSFLGESLVFLVAALIVVPICKRLGLSSVLGYLGAGVLIGPGGLGMFSETLELLHFAEIGVVLLLFVIGLELHPKRLWVMRRTVFSLGSAQMIGSTTVIAVALKLILGWEWPVVVLLGFALALSSTAFVLQLLGEQHKLNHTHGRAAFGVLLFQDVAVIPAIVILNLYSPAPGSAAATVDPVLLGTVFLGLLVARYTLRPILGFIASTGIHELFIAAGLAIVVGSALAMQSVGLSMGLGAFIAGMMVADSEYRHQLEADVVPFKALLLGLFFMAVGMSTNLQLIVELPLVVVGLTLGLVTLKSLVMFVLARLHGMDNAESLRSAIVLSQGGEFAFVLLTAGANAMLISAPVLEVAVLVVTLSMASTPLIVGCLERLLTPKEGDQAFDDIDDDEHPVVIAGFGRVGQIVARILSMRQIPFTALEVSASQVDFVRQFGNKIYFGDAKRLDLLKAAHVDQARAFILSVDDVEASIKIATMVSDNFPTTPIFARARNRHHELMLRDLGVRFIIRETLLSSLELSKSVLDELGGTNTTEVIDQFYQHDLETMDKQSAVFQDEKAYRQTTKDAAEELQQLFVDDGVTVENPGS